MQERVLVVAMPGMNNESGGFVDHQQVFVLIHNIERDILRRDGEVMRLMIQQHLNDIAGFDAVIGRYGLPVDPYITGIRSRLDAIAAGVGHVLGEVFVNAFFALTFIHLAAPALKDFFRFYVPLLIHQNHSSS